MPALRSIRPGPPNNYEVDDHEGDDNLVGSNESGDEFSDAVDYTMAAIKLECPLTDCTGGTAGARWSCEAESAVAVALLQIHGYSHQQTQAAAASDTRRPRPRPLPPPKLEGQCSESRFAEWKVE